jgi:hypothetical protein
VQLDGLPAALNVGNRCSGQTDARCELRLGEMFPFAFSRQEEAEFAIHEVYPCHRPNYKRHVKDVVQMSL